jgi:hypothetical protein
MYIHLLHSCAVEWHLKVDGLLSSSVQFWAAMELLLDMVARNKERAETLLRHSR